VTDVSVFFNNVDAAVDTQELVGDTFTRRYRVQGDPARAVTLTGYWSPAAQEFLDPIEGQTGVPYAWGPMGTAVGGLVWTGDCNVGYMIGPTAGVDDFYTFTLEIKIVTRTSDTLSAPTGATAGIPGAYTPSGSGAPADLAGMTGVTASPTSAWTAGQYVRTAALESVHWDGTAWAAGAAPGALAARERSGREGRERA